ncbi:hypothetical protein [Methylotenera sp.]|uniref:hypothetical protein n=2 Tax=Methylotenera sp. TaxID=2051956 RepID=UPI00272CFE6E|nr:hypothetical protein [Methylotenera sp.]MDP2071239.1 hypothetical protein [Methylotenera sp.]MDP3005156.1 hypothetical protein [Methylotenera sp.]
MKMNSHLPTRHQKFNKPMLQLLTAVTFSLMLPHVNAAEVTKSAKLATSVEYDSNPSLSGTTKNPVWIYTLTPQFQLDITDEVNRWFLDTAFLVQRYSNEKVLVNRDDPRVMLGWDRTYESGMYGIKAEYQESSSRVDELKSTGEFSSLNNTEKSKVLAAKWQHAISPRWSILTDGGYKDVAFTVPGVLINYSIADIKSQLSYANSEKLETYTQLGFSQLRPERDYENTDLAQLMVGANYQVSQGLTLSSRAGVYSLSGRQSDSDWQAGIKAEKTTERANYSVGLSRDIVASGVGGFRKADSLQAMWNFNVSERNFVGAEYQLDRYKKDASVLVDKFKFQQFLAFYDRILTDHWKARLSAARKETDSPATSAQSNVIGVSLVYDTLSF